jgi:hypothetical protein
MARRQARAITRKVGKGRITYIGAWLDAGMATREVDGSGQWRQERFGPVPEGVEVYPRYDQRGGLHPREFLEDATDCFPTRPR